MKFKTLIILILLPWTHTAFAEENTAKSEWMIGISGGITAIEESTDQTFASLSINRSFGETYAGLTVSHLDSGNVPGLVANIPASTTQFTFSGGTSVNAVNIEGYLSYGFRNFDIESLSRNGQNVNIDSEGDTLGLGLSLSYDFAANENLFITPIVSVDYNELDTARAANLPNGQQIGIKNSENGIAGTVGVAIQHFFGRKQNHLASFLANTVSTSNTSSFNPGSANYPVLRALAQRDEPGQKDSWAEFGGSISLELRDNLRWDISIIQTFGFLNNDATSISSGLSYSF